MILQRVHLANDAERECRSSAIGQRLAAPLTTRFPQASPGELRGTYDHAHHLMGREACLVASRSVKRAGGSVASAVRALIGRRGSRDGRSSLGLRARSYRTSSLGRPTRLHPHAHTRRQYELVCRETAAGGGYPAASTSSPRPAYNPPASHGRRCFPLTYFFAIFLLSAVLV